MRNLVRVSVLLTTLMVGGSSARVEAAPSTKADEMAFEWCLSQFPEEDNLWSGEDTKPLPRPAEEFGPFDLADARIPPGLITRTEVVGSLPPEIKKYKGQWIWPTHEDAPRFAIFVERLTATEMTIGWAIKPEKDKDEGAYRDLRTSLKWTGKWFSHFKSSAKGSETLDILISANGEAMLVWSGYSRTVTLEDRSGKQSSHTFSEGWPLCFISSKRH